MASVKGGPIVSGPRRISGNRLSECTGCRALCITVYGGGDTSDSLGLEEADVQSGDRILQGGALNMFYGASKHDGEPKSRNSESPRSRGIRQRQ